MPLPPRTVSFSRLVSLVFLSCLALPVAAQRAKSVIPDLDDPGRKGEMARMIEKRAEERFDAADEDKNGSISRAEAAKHLPYLSQKFDEADKNGDGALSWEEFIGHDHWERQRREAK